MPTLWKKIMKKIDINEYNKWLEKQKFGGIGKYERFWMFTGVRLFWENERKEHPAEYLPPEKQRGH